MRLVFVCSTIIEANICWARNSCPNFSEKKFRDSPNKKFDVGQNLSEIFLLLLGHHPQNVAAQFPVNPESVGPELLETFFLGPEVAETRRNFGFGFRLRRLPSNLLLGAGGDRNILSLEHEHALKIENGDFKNLSCFCIDRDDLRAFQPNKNLCKVETGSARANGSLWP